MTNGGIIEGFASEDKPRSLPKANSDLSPVTSFPNGSMRVFHGAGTTDEEKMLGGGLTFQTGITRLADRGPPHYRPYHSENPPSKRRRDSVPSTFLLLGAGTARLQMQAKASKAGGLMKLRHPAPKSFYEIHTTSNNRGQCKLWPAVQWNHCGLG
jgi:hypothetical protein